jgi:hypothetical protein
MRSLVCFTLIGTILAIAAPGIRAHAAEAQPTTKPGALELVPYENKEKGIALKRPKDWESLGSFGGGMIAMFLKLGDAQDGAADTLTISLIHSADPTKLDDVVDQMLATLKVQFSDFKLIDNKPAKLGGKPARNVVFTGNGTGADVEVRVAICLVGQDAYSLMLQTVPRKYGRLEPTFDAVIDSFAFTGKDK